MCTSLFSGMIAVSHVILWSNVLYVTFLSYERRVRQKLFVCIISRQMIDWLIDRFLFTPPCSCCPLPCLPYAPPPFFWWRPYGHLFYFLADEGFDWLPTHTPCLHWGLLFPLLQGYGPLSITVLMMTPWCTIICLGKRQTVVSLVLLCRSQGKRRKAVTSPFVNGASLKPTLHDQSLDGDITVCGFP